MGVGWSLGLMVLGLPMAVVGAAVYRSQERLAAVMLAGTGLLLVGAVLLLIRLW